MGTTRLECTSTNMHAPTGGGYRSLLFFLLKPILKNRLPPCTQNYNLALIKTLHFGRGSITDLYCFFSRKSTWKMLQTFAAQTRDVPITDIHVHKLPASN